MQNTGETTLSGAGKIDLGCGVGRGRSTSERAQQHGADERKYGEHRQHVEPQGKVHVTSSRVNLRISSLAGGRRRPNDKYAALPNARARILSRVIRARQHPDMSM
jgi:hypothetical protein